MDSASEIPIASAFGGMTLQHEDHAAAPNTPAHIVDVNPTVHISEGLLIGLRHAVDYTAPPEALLPPVFPYIKPAMIGDTYWICSGGLGPDGGCKRPGTWPTAHYDTCLDCSHRQCPQCRSIV